MVAAAGSLIWEASQIPFSQPLYLLGANSLLLTLGSALFLPGSSVLGSRPEESRLVVVEDIRLGSAGIQVYSGRAIRAAAQEELLDEPTAAEGAKETAPRWPQRFTHLPLPFPTASRTTPDALLRQLFGTSPWY